MSTVPVLERTVEVDSDFLPASAAKLIITQYLECEDTSSWAWIIVGTFFDSRDQPLWSTEIFIAQLDIDSDSEYSDNTDESYHGGSEDLQSEANSTTEETQDLVASSSLEQDSQSFPSYIPSTPSNAYDFPPIWDPVIQGPVPGHWQARFDPHLRRWIHTWQSHF